MIIRVLAVFMTVLIFSVLCVFREMVIMCGTG